MHTHARMHAHMHACTHAHSHTHKHTHTYIQKRMHAYTHIHTHTHTHTHTHAQTLTHIHTHTHTHLPACTHLYTNTCRCTHANTCTLTYTHTCQSDLFPSCSRQCLLAFTCGCVVGMVMPCWQSHVSSSILLFEICWRLTQYLSSYQLLLFNTQPTGMVISRQGISLRRQFSVSVSHAMNYLFLKTDCDCH